MYGQRKLATETRCEVSGYMSAETTRFDLTNLPLANGAAERFAGCTDEKTGCIVKSVPGNRTAWEEFWK
ncbi:hypothetical protein BaRGS_00015817 [Batillaria attramentaria]|uniref:Uncharacterized protein n=1 Tax=Batillaria attramentaria TaxID=370345 RepID=A0ABD0L0H5_9CAEN